MTDTFTINEPELATYLVTLAYICLENDTDNCDLKLTTKNGVINCHIEFSTDKEQSEDGKC